MDTGLHQQRNVVLLIPARAQGDSCTLKVAEVLVALLNSDTPHTNTAKMH